MLTMLIGGLWHGASWTFVVWGGLHGLYLVIERLLRKKIRIQTDAIVTQILFAFLTFTGVNITWVFFRSESFEKAWNLIRSMFFVAGEEMILTTNFIVLTLGLMLMVFVSHFAMRHLSLVGLIERIPRTLLVLLWGLMIFGLFIVQSSGQQFIYFQF
jgi:alginate O-acetyltransferase complex protein AlgI